MIDTHFSTRDISFLITGFSCILLAIGFFHYGKHRLALVTLIAGGFAFRLMMAFIDPFVNIWDEQFHALVAKNLTLHMFHPTLVENPILPTDPAYWVFTQTWLHKPPLFLWQMAISIKLFGTSAWAIRMPSVLLSSLMIPAIYQMGLRISNERTGFLAALILTVSNIHVNIVSGFLNTDQNDVVFAAYVLFSFWAWTEYAYSFKKKWILLVGLFAGAAVLTKWLPGLLVFGAWGVGLVQSKEHRRSFSRWLHLTAALLIASLVAFPWFAFVANKWPEEWGATLQLYHGHFAEVQGHSGPWWFHFGEYNSQFGIAFCALTICSFLDFIRSKNASMYIRYGYAISVITVFVFYTFVSARMPLFCLIIVPLLFIMIAYAMNSMLSFWQLRQKRIAHAAAYVICLWITFSVIDIGRLEHYHTDRDPKEFYRKTRIHNKACFESASQHVPANAVLFNCGSWNAVPCMFYTDHTAYDDLPSAGIIRAAQVQKKSIAIFDDGNLPAYILQDSSLIILHEQLIRNGF